MMTAMVTLKKMFEKLILKGPNTVFRFGEGGEGWLSSKILDHFKDYKKNPIEMTNSRLTLGIQPNVHTGIAEMLGESREFSCNFLPSKVQPSSCSPSIY